MAAHIFTICFAPSIQEGNVKEVPVHLSRLLQGYLEVKKDKAVALKTKLKNEVRALLAWS